MLFLILHLCPSRLRNIKKKRGGIENKQDPVGPFHIQKYPTTKVMLKILQARLQQYVNRELPDGQSGFRKGIGTEIRLPTSAGSWKKQENSRKTSVSAFLTMPKPLTVWITISCGKF